MFAWFRRIRRINIFGFEIEFDHPPEKSPDKGGSTGRLIEKPGAKTVAPGARMVAHGKVIKAYGSDLGVRVENETEIREFWRANQMDTKLDWFGPGAPVVSITAKYAAGCKVGDKVAITLEVVDRAGGKRGGQPVAFEVRSRV
ncbi:hypothetical protein V5E97_02340 [Singulisphaera sp. Ch08]|uniref:Uncharacterized protein n=1 Tax=Singulisphaera sp. Ch08 TaxID=3120278 RepID=A0AAU7CIK5_9BACT